ncbi:unnamed protein product [Rotaria sp. Silwood1]|nr:unnamed protein product [Rotaria sp. Silwood1]
MIIAINTCRDYRLDKSKIVGFIISINSICIRYGSHSIEKQNKKNLISGLIIISRDNINTIQLFNVIEDKLSALNKLGMKVSENYE